MTDPNKTSKSVAKARFDARLSKGQKELFEQAAKIKGYKSLSDFVIQVTQEAALVIIEKHKTIIASEKDQEIFFHILMHPPKPNKALLKAVKEYDKKLSQR